MHTSPCTAVLCPVAQVSACSACVVRPLFNFQSWRAAGTIRSVAAGFTFCRGSPCLDAVRFRHVAHPSFAAPQGVGRTAARFVGLVASRQAPLGYDARSSKVPSTYVACPPIQKRVGGNATGLVTSAQVLVRLRSTMLSYAQSGLARPRRVACPLFGFQAGGRQARYDLAGRANLCCIRPGRSRFRFGRAVRPSADKAEGRQPPASAANTPPPALNKQSKGEPGFPVTISHWTEFSKRGLAHRMRNVAVRTTCRIRLEDVALAYLLTS